ncbi:MAG: GNAT family N-acetyltransferase, partial [Chloroflexota bacterium]|nr:GNAT family N-acetyltransferase [Chloroflexota bacterium]
VDIGVATLDRWRRQGLATAAAAQVAGAIQRDGRIPVWSCGGHNAASLAIAARLGFREVARRTYLVPAFEAE